MAVNQLFAQRYQHQANLDVLIHFIVLSCVFHKDFIKIVCFVTCIIHRPHATIKLIIKLKNKMNRGIERKTQFIVRSFPFSL
jgi:hypothetical protein